MESGEQWGTLGSVPETQPKGKAGSGEFLGTQGSIPQSPNLREHSPNSAKIAREYFVLSSSFIVQAACAGSCDCLDTWTSSNSFSNLEPRIVLALSIPIIQEGYQFSISAAFLMASAYPPALGRYVQALHREHPDWTNQMLADACGIGSEGTVRNMLAKDMSDDAFAARRETTIEALRIISPVLEATFCGEVIWRDLLRKDTSTLSLRRRLKRDFGVEPKDDSWFSRFVKRNELSFHKATLSHQSEFKSSKFDEYLAFLAHFQAFHFAPDHVINIDPTSVYSDTRHVLQVAAMGSYLLPCQQNNSFRPYRSFRDRPRREGNPRGSTEKSFTTTRGDGEMFLFYRSTAPELANVSGLDPTFEHIHLVAPGRPSHIRPLVQDVLVLLDTLWSSGFLKPNSAGSGLPSFCSSTTHQVTQL
jgi:hypothetical protein